MYTYSWIRLFVLEQKTNTTLNNYIYNLKMKEKAPGIHKTGCVYGQMKPMKSSREEGDFLLDFREGRGSSVWAESHQ